MYPTGQSVRDLTRRPASAVATVVVLALGVAAFTAVSSVVRRLLLRPLPVPGIGELVVGWETDPARTDSLVEVSLPYFRELRERNRSFTRMAAFGSVNWSHELRAPGGRPQTVAAAAVSASFFETLGVRPLLGRGFLPHEDEPGAEGALVLSYGLWQSRYSGDPSVVGSTLPTGETIVGVMPKDFDFPRGAEVWKPVAVALEPVRESMAPAAFRGLGVLYVLGRLKPGATLEAARADLGETSARLSLADGFSSEGWRMVLVPLVDHHLGSATREALETLGAAAGLLLLFACANAGLLLLAHVVGRRDELAVRRALGATTTRVVADQAAKSLVVASLGGAVGTLLAAAALKGVVALAPGELPGIRDVRLDAAALGIAVLATLLAAVLVTLPSAWYASRLPVAPTLKAVGGGAATDRRGRSLSRALVASEVAMAVVLLAGSALLIRSLERLLEVPLGFVPEHALSFGVDRWDEEGDALEEPAFIHALLERVGALPEVTAAGAVYLRPLEHGPIGSDAWVLPEGAPLDLASVQSGSVNADWQSATPGYFRAVGTRLLAGRAFSEADAREAPKVVVVSESLARLLWPEEDPVGRRLHTHGARARLEGGRFVDVEWMTVVGVVEDARYRGIRRPRPVVYLSYRQAPSLPQHFVVRTSGDPLEAVGAIREQARALDPTARVGAVATLESLVDRALAPWRFAGGLLSAFAAVALVLTAAGLVGVLHRSVTLQRREIAIRIAVGASARSVAARVVAQGLAMTGLGLALGLAASFGLGGSLAALLYGVGRSDPWSHLGAAGLIALIAAVACGSPARRAARTDPITALRSE